MCCLVAVVALAAGAAPAAPPGPPVTVRDYQAQLSSREGYPPIVISQHNLQRVLAADLPAAERVESFKLVARLGAPSKEAMSMLVALMADANTPQPLREAMLTATLRGADGGATAFVLEALNAPNLSEDLEAELLGWIEAHGSPQMLADVIKRWAENPPNGPNEARYRLIVEHISGGEWDEVLLSAMGQQAFYARGSSQVVLAARLSPEEYRRKVLAARPTHGSIAALQTFVRGFDYIPATKAEMLTTVTLYVQERNTINAAAGLYADWRNSSGYAFTVRDYHLLAALARAPELAGKSRQEMVAELAQVLAARGHVAHRFGGTGEPVFDARLYRVEGRLTMIDLWNITLLDELLSRREIQAGIKVLADRDLADTEGAWGGLVFFERGRATAKQYPPAPAEVPNDLVYLPTGRMLDDSHNSLCRFITHFEKVNNSDRVGPTPDELADAEANDYYGMTITRLDESRFTAHYFNPDGVVVSLGTFPFSQPAQ